MPLYLRKTSEEKTDRSKELRPLMPHQEKAVAYLNERMNLRKGGNLFMEMRLGKTLSFIRFARQRMFKLKILVICPLTVCKTWEKELAADGILSSRVVGGLGTKNIKKVVADKDGVPVSWWTITNFESVTPSDLLSYKFDVIVVDESVRISNPNAKTTKYLSDRRINETPFRYCLSGNPAPEDTLQYIPQILFTQGSFAGKDNFWRVRSSLFELNGFSWVPMIGTEFVMHSEVHSKSFILTRDQAGIGSKKIHEKRFVKMTKAQAKEYYSMLMNFEVENLQTEYITTQILYLNRIAGGMLPTKEEVDPDNETWLNLAKFEEVIELLNGELRGEQCLVWCRFRAEARMMEKMLREKCKDLKGCRIDGSVKSADRERLRLEFLDKRIDVSVMTISTSKVGTDWSSADTEIYISNEYSADARTQSEDRIVHPKKTKPLLVIDIITENSVDEEVIDSLRDKRTTSKMFLGKLLDAVKKFRYA